MSDDIWIQIRTRIPPEIKCTNRDELTQMLRYQTEPANCGLVFAISTIIGIDTKCKTDKFQQATCDRRREILRVVLEISTKETRQRRQTQTRKQHRALQHAQKERQEDCLTVLRSDHDSYDYGDNDCSTCAHIDDDYERCMRTRNGD